MMLAIHLFLYTIEVFYGITGSNNILCDNKGTLHTFERKSKQIPAGAKNNNVHQVLQHVKSRMESLHLLHHVKAHEDD